MKLKVIGTGSSGNSYALIDKYGEAIIIEAGCSRAAFYEAVGFREIKKVNGLICTHEHGDHAGYIEQYASSGIECYASPGTINAIKSKPKNVNRYSEHRYREMPVNKITEIGRFSVLPFEIKHDAAEPVGFIIKHDECGRIVFLTDTMYSKFRFGNINHWIVEANYSKEILENRAQTGSISLRQNSRINTNHMSIDTLVEMLKANDISQTRNIILIHLSDRNSDQEAFRKKVESETGIPTDVATSGASYNLDLFPF